MSTHWLTAFGLLLHSELPVPGAQPAEPGKPDLTITQSAQAKGAPGLDSETWVPAPGADSTPYRYDGSSLLFTMPNVARYRCQAGRPLTVEPFPGADPEEVSALLIATAIPAALWMRGDLVLHAAGFILPGHTRAVAFAGPSGSGKSTLLRHLVAQGATAVGDDTLCLREQDSKLIVSGLPACTQHRVHGSPSRTLRPIPPAQQSGAAELSALIVAGPEQTRTRLRGPDALAAVLRNLHRPLVPEILAIQPALFGRLVALVQRLPVYSMQCRAELLHPNLRNADNADSSASD